MIQTNFQKWQKQPTSCSGLEIPPKFKKSRRGTKKRSKK